MAKYQTKIVEIEAIEFTEDNIKHIYPMANKAGYFVTFGIDEGKHYLYIDTDEGRMRAEEGDFVIKGLRGEIYSCKPDVFHGKYEKVDENASE